jgi:hypothetical protein
MLQFLAVFAKHCLATRKAQEMREDDWYVESDVVAHLFGDSRALTADERSFNAMMRESAKTVVGKLVSLGVVERRDDTSAEIRLPYDDDTLADLALPKTDQIAFWREKRQRDEAKERRELIGQKVLEILSSQLHQFECFFASRSTDQCNLTHLSKVETRALTENLERILHVLKASQSLNAFQNDGTEEQFVARLLQIVQQVIAGQANVKQTLYRDDFKLILQVVFLIAAKSLSEAKNTKPSAAGKEERVTLSCKTKQEEAEDFRRTPIVSQVLQFLERNRGLLNEFITSTASHSDSLLQLVSTMPKLLEFSSKRVLWRQLVKRNLRSKGDDYEVDL